MQDLVDIGHVADVNLFADARHELVVVGMPEEGFRLWCRRCDRMGVCTYKSFSVAQRYAIKAWRGLVPCRSTERAA